MDDRRDADAVPDAEAATDEAVFSPRPLRRGRTPMAGVAIATLIGVLTAAGVLGGLDEPAPSGAPLVAVAATPPTDSSVVREAPWRDHPGTGEPARVAALLTVHARLSGEQAFVSGDVFTLRAVLVVVTVVDAEGAALAVQGVDIPGGSTAFRLGANDRFDVAFRSDDWPRPAAWVTATAYDRTGWPIESIREPLAAASGAAAVPAGTEGGWPPSRLAGDAFVPVRLDEPGAGIGPMHGAEIVVRGKLRIHAASVRVALQALDGTVFQEARVITANIDGGIRPVRAPAIDVALALPKPRPIGERLWVIVTAYDEAGRVLGVVRRLVTVGALGS